MDEKLATRLVAAPPWPETVAINAAGDLELGGVGLPTIAEKFGTPVYVLDVATFLRRARAYRGALSRHYPGDAEVHYAGKAFLNVAVAQLVLREALHLDAVSLGELHIGRYAGLPGERLHLHGNAKTEAELTQARRMNVGSIIVDSIDELRTLARLTSRHEQQAILLRLAPDVPVDTHPHIATGMADAKFGIPLSRLDEAAHILDSAPQLRYEGLHCHIGSQLTDMEPYRAAVRVLLDAAMAMWKRYGWPTRVISPGGGLGIAQTIDDVEPDIDRFVAAVATEVVEGCRERGLPLPKLVVEPGRSIVGPAAVALYRIVATKSMPPHLATMVPYLHLDGGIGDNSRPAMYGARLAAAAVRGADRPAQMVAHLSGRYCESADILARNVALPSVTPGDLVAVPAAGAYTLSMASNYNQVPRPPMVFVWNGQAQLVTRRETHHDLVARDVPLAGSLAAGLPDVDLTKALSDEPDQPPSELESACSSIEI